MKDLLRCLRQPPFGTETSERDIMSAAADEIEQLRARAERAENGLEQIADVWEIMWRGKHKEASADWIVPDMLAYVKDKDKELDDYLSRAERAEAALAAHMETCVTEQICIDKIVKDRDADVARAERAEVALKEIQRRTALLLSQNTGLWKMTIEHDRRTADVLIVNQDIARAVLEKIETTK